MRQLRVASAFFLSASLAAHAQAKLQSLNLVMPNGKGRVIVPLSDQHRLQRLSYAPPNDYGSGGPAVTFHDTTANLEMVYSLTGNDTNSAKDCLDKAMDASERSFAMGAGRADIKQADKSTGANANGQSVASGSYLITAMNNAKTSQQHVFNVVATHDLCAEMQIAKPDYTSADDATIQTALQSLSLDAGYTPVSTDYFLMATLITQLGGGRGGAGAAPYDQRALDTLPADAPSAIRRVIIDRLSTSYDRIGQADKGRAINEAAIKTDADYPMYYYNLARIDAEDFKIADAKTHLQQAWDRKANLPAGQQMPDPTKDPSLQQLKNKADFWSYVQSLK